jgi:inner membrane transporter RhtA
VEAAVPPQGVVERLPAPLLFVAGAVSQYAGAALAVGLFAVVPAVGVGWLRIVGAALVLLAWRRPWRTLGAYSRGQALVVVGFGASLAAMNLAFYQAIDHLPLGTAVAIEFLGPIAVAAVGTRRARDAAALVLAGGGVALLADVRLGGSPAGVAWALTAASCWALYIVLGSRVSGGGQGIDGLAVAMALGGLVFAPIAGPLSAPAFTDAGLLLACVAVGVLSSAVPYALDQVVLRRVPPARFAVLLALLPATAVLVGMVVLAQIPTPTEAAGIALVIAAVYLGNRRVG